jgi:hypothetical protein
MRMACLIVLECELSLTLNILSYCTDCVLIDVALLGSIRIESNESFHPSDQTSLGTRHRISIMNQEASWHIIFNFHDKVPFDSYLSTSSTSIIYECVD